MPTIQPKFGLVFTKEQDAKKYDKYPYSFFWWSAEQRALPKAERGNRYGQLYYVVNGPADNDKDVFTQALQDFEGQRSRSVIEGNNGTVLTAVGFDNKEAHAAARASLHEVHEALAVKADAPVPTVIEGTVLKGSSRGLKSLPVIGRLFRDKE